MGRTEGGEERGQDRRGEGVHLKTGEGRWATRDRKGGTSGNVPKVGGSWLQRAKQGDSGLREEGRDGERSDRRVINTQETQEVSLISGGKQ